MKTVKTIRYASPAGELLIGAYGNKICLCDWAGSRRRAETDRHIQEVLDAEYEEVEKEALAMCDKTKAAKELKMLKTAMRQLDEYFAGKRKVFALPVLLTGSEFQCTIWKYLTKVPFGGLITYGELARRIGHPEAVRAVAGAVARNPISIFIPCHRVIGADRTLVGYGGGLMAKQYLLDLEFYHSPDGFFTL